MVLAFMAQHVWEVGASVLAALIIGQGLSWLIRGSSVARGRGMSERIARSSGGLAVLIGVGVEIAALSVHAEQAGVHGGNGWGGASGIVILCAWVALMCAGPMSKFVKTVSRDRDKKPRELLEPVMHNAMKCMYGWRDAGRASAGLRYARPGVVPAKMLRQAAVASSVLGLLLSGCGSDSSGLSRSSLDTKADSICQRGTSEIKAAGSIPADFETNSAAAAAYLDRVVPISDKTISELSTLKPDGGVQGEWNQFMASIRAAATRLDAARTKAHSGDPNGLQDFAQATGPLTQTLDSAARRVGAVGCAN